MLVHAQLHRQVVVVDNVKGIVVVVVVIVVIVAIVGLVFFEQRRVAHVLMVRWLLLWLGKRALEQLVDGVLEREQALDVDARAHVEHVAHAHLLVQLHGGRVAELGADAGERGEQAGARDQTRRLEGELRVGGAQSGERVAVTLEQSELRLVGDVEMV